MGVLLTAAPAGAATSGYTLLIAADPKQIAAAQRLRHQVFAEELGATLHSAIPGLDVDEFDAFCDHLIVRDDASGEVVGTYRMLPPKRAAAAGRRYGDTEFELSALAPLRDHLVETGRSCVHPAHRSGAVINLIWAGIARYLHLNGYRWLGGCASVPLADGGALAAGVWDLVRARHLSPPALRVRPRRPWLSEPAATAAVPAADAIAGVPMGSAVAALPTGSAVAALSAAGAPAAVSAAGAVAAVPTSGAPAAASTAGAVAAGAAVVPVAGSDSARPPRVAVPALLRGYLRLGAWVCGEPAHDPDFGVADLYVLLSLDRVDPRYLRHFLGESR